MGRTIESYEKDQRALELRKEGHTYESILEQLLCGGIEQHGLSRTAKPLFGGSNLPAASISKAKTLRLQRRGVFFVQ